MKNLLTAILFIFLIACQKESEKQPGFRPKEYVFKSTIDPIDDIETDGLFFNNEKYILENHIQYIAENKYSEDSLSYKNDVQPDKYIFSNSILETAYGNVKFIPSATVNKESDVSYTYAGYAECIDRHIIQMQLYEGEKTLLLSNKNYSYSSIASFPFFSENRKYAVSFKDHEGLSSQISVYRIENKILKPFITLWSEKYIPDHLAWDNSDHIVLHLREIGTSTNVYAKIAVAALINRVQANPKPDITKVDADWKGRYQITAKAISEYNQKQIDLLYTITITSRHTAVLSIGADQVQDYWCEGEYMLKETQGVLHAKGKCDEDDSSDFYLKQDKGSYFIKTKRFLNQDWQEIKKLD